MNAPGAELPQRVAEDLLIRAGVTARQHPRVQYIPSGNRVFSISSGHETFFAKFPAKDFVPDVAPLTQAAGRVVAEAAALDCLRRRGLPSVEVVAVERDDENPAGWPYLLMRGVDGRPMIDAVKSLDSHRQALLVTGAYLAAMHDIRFDTTGYIVTPDGPAADPCGRSQAGCHDPAMLRDEAWRDLARARPHIPPRRSSECGNDSRASPRSSRRSTTHRASCTARSTRTTRS